MLMTINRKMPFFSWWLAIPLFGLATATPALAECTITPHQTKWDPISFSGSATWSTETDDVGVTGSFEFAPGDPEGCQHHALSVEAGGNSTSADSDGEDSMMSSPFALRAALVGAGSTPAAAFASGEEEIDVFFLTVGYRYYPLVDRRSRIRFFIGASAGLYDARSTKLGWNAQLGTILRFKEEGPWALELVTTQHVPDRRLEYLDVRVGLRYTPFSKHQGKGRRGEIKD